MSTKSTRQLCARFWFPLYAFVRRQGYDAHETKYLIEEFYALFLGKDYLKDDWVALVIVW